MVVVLGLVTLAKFVIKATGVFLQTFILPGTSVSVRRAHNRYVCYLFLIDERIFLAEKVYT